MGHGQHYSCLNFRQSKSSGKRTRFGSSNLLIFGAEKYKQTSRRIIFPYQYISVGCISFCYPKQVFRDFGEMIFFCQISRGRIPLISHKTFESNFSCLPSHNPKSLAPNQTFVHFSAKTFLALNLQKKISIYLVQMQPELQIIIINAYFLQIRCRFNAQLS